LVNIGNDVNTSSVKAIIEASEEWHHCENSGTASTTKNKLLRSQQKITAEHKGISDDKTAHKRDSPFSSIYSGSAI
jgi:hypothetical protein